MLIELVVSIVAEVFWQAVMELGVYGVEQATRAQRIARSPVVAVIGLLFLSSSAGCVSASLLPARILPSAPIPGLSLLLSPLTTGMLMHGFGKWTRARGGEPSVFATFWGGSLSAFAFAWTRWALLN